MRERYSIDVSDNIAEIHGNLTITEVFDFLSYFDKQGYNKVIPGDGTTVLTLYKRDPEDDIPAPIEEKTLWETCYEETKKDNEHLTRRVKELESLIKTLLSSNKEECPELVKFLRGFENLHGN